MSSTGSRSPVVLFVCVQNAGRSQMAEHLFDRAVAGRAEARSAGTRPADAVHRNVVEALDEVGIDVSRVKPKRLSPEVTQGVDVVVTMGCGDECPAIPGARVVDWDLTDPAGLTLAQTRAIRDDIDRRVRDLVAELGL